LVIHRTCFWGKCCNFSSAWPILLQYSSF
jgi:hypothetical protein